MAPPRRMWWVYLVVLLALATSGAGAAEALFVVRDYGDFQVAQACLTSTGFSVFSEADPLSTARADTTFADCSADYNARRGAAAVVGAVALPLVAWLFMVVGGAISRRGLRRRLGTPVARLARRFDEVCGSQGLTDRIRPLLVLAPPTTGIRSAYTTGLPFSRPWVVVPSSYEHKPTAEFDVVVLHELAHVRSRDLLWASSVWWAGWLVVPTFLLSVVSAVGQSTQVWKVYGDSVAISLVTAVTTLALRAALLRRRELAADDYAAAALNDVAAVRSVVGRGKARTRSALRRAFATHPDAAERGKARAGRASGWEGGFIFTAAVGVVVMLGYQLVLKAMTDLLGYVDTDPRLHLLVSSTVASTAWVAVVIPSWTRRAEGGTGWAGPWTGVVVGLVGGFLLHPAGSSSDMLSAFGGHWPLVVVCLGLAAFAIAVLAAGCASALAGTRDTRRWLGQLGTVIAVAPLLAATWTSLYVAALVYHLMGDLAAARRQLQTPFVAVWQLAPVTLFLGLLLVIVAAGTPAVRHCGAVVAVTGTTGGVVAGLSLLLRFSDDERLRLVQIHQMWWITALAGVTALVTTLAVNRAGTGALRAAPLAVATGVLATMWAGLVQFMVIFSGGRGHNWLTFWTSLSKPQWLFSITVVAVVPVLLLLLGRGIRPHRAPRARMWAPSAGAAIVAVSLLLVGGLLTTVTVSEEDNDDTHSIAARVRSNGLSAGEQPEPSSRVGRALDQATAANALDGIRPLLPPATESTTPTEEGPVELLPQACNETVNQNSAAERARPVTADIKQSYTAPIEKTVAGVDIKVKVSSAVAGSQDLADIDRELTACSQFRVPARDYDSGVVDCGMRLVPTTGDTYPTRSIAISCRATTHLRTVITISRQQHVVVDHNTISVVLVYRYIDAPPAETSIQAVEGLLTDITTSITDRLAR